jgi:hypothetical protein
MARRWYRVRLWGKELVSVVVFCIYSHLIFTELMQGSVDPMVIEGTMSQGSRR